MRTKNPVSDRPPLYSGVAVTGSASIAVGLGFALLQVANQALHPGVLILSSATGLGLCCGFIARLSLLRRGAFVRWVVALFGLSSGLIFLGWLTRGELGVNLMTRAPAVDWRGLLQFGVGSLTAWLAVRAWFYPDRGPDRRDRVVAAPGAVRALFPRRHVSAAPLRAGSLTLGARRAVAVRVRERRPGPRIRLASAIDHRCPYCLGMVDENDRRGVRACPVCHTLHHADCWDVTGACQVPHHHS